MSTYELTNLFLRCESPPPPSASRAPLSSHAKQREWTGRSALISLLLKISPIRFKSEVGGADGERRVGNEGGSKFDSQGYV